MYRGTVPSNRAPAVTRIRLNRAPQKYLNPVDRAILG